MRIKKIRGHKRIWKDIQQWRLAYSRLDAQFVNRKHVKIWVHPYSGYSLLGSKYPEPKGRTRKKILEGLLDIHDSWKKELDSTGEPYYLKLWLYEPQFSRSQVVCAIGDFREFYDSTFHKPEIQRKFPFGNYGKLQDRLKNFTWEYAHEEIVIDEDSIGAPEDFISLKEFHANRRWIKKKLKGGARTAVTDDGEAYDLFRIGDVWLGSIE